MNFSNETILNSDQDTVNGTDKTRQGLLPVKIIMILATVSMNLTILNAIIFKVKQKKYSYYLFLSITTGDLIVGLSSMSFMTIFTYFLYWPLGYALCVFWVIVDYSTSTINLVSILLLTIQRFMLIKYPFKTKETFTWPKAILIFSVWIICYSYWLSSVLAITLNPNFDYKNCYFTYTFTYVITTDLINYGLPVLLIAIFSYLTMHALFQNRASTSTNNTQMNKMKAKKTEQAFLCIMLVALNIISFWMLFIVCWPINAYCNGCLDPILMEMSYWLAYLASTTNPIILLVFNKSIRKRCIKLIRNILHLKGRINIANANSTSVVTGKTANQQRQQKTDTYS